MPSLLVPARYYVRLGEVLARDGLDLMTLVGELRLSRAPFEDAEGLLPASQVDRLVVGAMERAGRRDLGFDLGGLLSVSAHSFVGFGMLSSATVEQALRFVARYFRLVMPSFQLRTLIRPDHAELHFTPTVAMSHGCLAFHLDTMATAALREIGELCGGQRPPCRVLMSLPAPAHAGRFEELRDVRAQFGVDGPPGVRVQVLADLSRRPLAMADDSALQVAEQRCRTLVERVTRVRQFSDWVAMSLREAPEGIPPITELARALAISPRTLNRHLESEGTSYRQLAGQVQHALACERLATAGLSITEVGYSLGFSSPANFTRAFRAREGCSPQAYRLALQPRANRTARPGR
ncbi:MAG TPA: AraC family transcriptional regulator ligand-binding domain-containing protein [Nevskiaceae bacterium]|nr:AraC family transcriptional regulator ligand-binding domain-containing protein [Nevskiaceae bacterium]